MKEIFKRHPRYDALPENFKSLPEDLWERCSRCKELIYSREVEQSLWVCPKCKYHFGISARQRLDITLDSGTFEEFDSTMTSADPLHFSNLGETYAGKLAQYRTESGEAEAYLYGTGKIDGQDLVIGLTEFKFAGASMGSVFGEKVARAFDLARERRLPLVLFSKGGGARMQEGTVSLLQMAKTVAALDRFKQTTLPYISIMTDPCLGGMTASYAMLGDVNIGEPGAYIGFAGRRVIEQTMRQKLPQDAATSEFLLEHGMLDMVVSRQELPGVLARLIKMYVGANPATPATQAIPRVEQYA
jgi:acetyl-CoA carboxylase carboxyl transferase subunit beta